MKMKAFVVCIIIIINIKSNGKASLESFLPTTNKILLDTTRNSENSCFRPCKFNVKPRRCFYEFEIEPTVGDDGRPAISVNGQTPGPNIHVCLHDVIVVRVKNNVPNQDVAVHWHGVEQRGTPFNDGVPMVTQCPITFGSVYQYSFMATSPGTFFYHADSVSQQSDGVYGSLIVDQPQPHQPHSTLYDFNSSDENTIIVGARYPKLLTSSLDDLHKIKPDSLVINGHEANYKAFVIPGYAYMFRLINAIAIECPVVVNFHGHTVNVIASDGKPVKPSPAKMVKLYPGERMDVVIRAEQKNAGYWIQVSGSDTCKGLHSHGMLLYSGFNYTSMLEDTPIYDLNLDDAVYGQNLLSLKDSLPVDKVKSVYLGIDRNYPKFKESDHDFSYVIDGSLGKPYIPAAVATQEGVIQINGKNFLYPNIPFLLKPREVLPESICFVGEETKHKETQCVQILNANPNDDVELILINEGFGSNDSYTFHMHGYNMHVLATWQSLAGMPLSREEFMKLDKGGKITRNLKDPPVKDTITVPNKGFAIVRLKIDFGGSWLLECRSCGLSALPVAMLINVHQSIPKMVADSLPTCGGYKPADVLLN